MAKVKSVYICSECGAESPKWVGKCPSCGAWNTYVEELIKKEPATWRAASGIVRDGMKPRLLRDVTAKEETRIDMHDAELNRVLGGGLVKGSLVLVGGEPGIGKSTLVLQTVLQMKGLHTLYVSGEESAQQLKMRADRLAGKDTDMGNCHVFCETNLEQIFVQAQNLQPNLLIIDSIQTMFTDRAESSPGSITQVRECSAAVLKFAKETGTPVLMIGHINKEGSIAGPKVLEHIVDTVLQFEGDQHYMYRILRSIKNRFGSTSELGIYEMRQSGLRRQDKRTHLNQAFQQTRDQAAWLKVLSFFLAGLLLWRLFGIKSAVKILSIPLMAIIATIAVFGWLNISIGLFTMFGLLLVSAIGIDYTAYMHSAKESLRNKRFAVLLAAITTIISFLLLGLSSTPAVAAFGLSVSIGVAINVLITFKWLR